MGWRGADNQKLGTADMYEDPIDLAAKANCGQRCIFMVWRCRYDDCCNWRVHSGQYLCIHDLCWLWLVFLLQLLDLRLTFEQAHGTLLTQQLYNHSTVQQQHMLQCQEHMRT